MTGSGSGIDLDGLWLELRILPATIPGRPWLVFLHEGLGSVGLWRDFPDRVAQATGAGVVVYSRAGYGGSSPVTLPRPLRYMHDEGLDILPRLLARLGIDDVVLIGHSDGASISLIHAGGASGPGLRGVVAMAPHVVNEECCIAAIGAARVAFETGDLRARLQRVHGDNVDVAFRGWNDAWLDPGFRDWSIVEFLPRIRVPVLVIQGHQDEYGSAVHYRTIEAECGAPVEVLLLDSCRHSPHRDQPDAVLAALVAFVAGLAPPAP
jgi:pimeloyl-ACP methyl ester carboxylesterase